MYCGAVPVAFLRRLDHVCEHQKNDDDKGDPQEPQYDRHDRGSLSVAFSID